MRILDAGGHGGPLMELMLAERKGIAGRAEGAGEVRGEEGGEVLLELIREIFNGQAHV